jgi:hypothetical protein
VLRPFGKCSDPYGRTKDVSVRSRDEGSLYILPAPEELGRFCDISTICAVCNSCKEFSPAGKSPIWVLLFLVSPKHSQFVDHSMTI